MKETEAERIDITGMPIGNLSKIYSEYEVYIERLGDRVYLVRTNAKKSREANINIMLETAKEILEEEGIDYIDIFPLEGTPTNFNDTLRYEFKFYSRETEFPKEQYINIYTLTDEEKVRRSRRAGNIDMDKEPHYEIVDKE